MTACGGGGEESPYAGKYNATSAEYLGYELEVDSIFEGGFSVTIESGGKYTVEFDGDSESGKWEEVDGVIVLDGELNFTVDPDAGTGTMDYSGVTLNFVRE
jgi:hypothetical protein